jgi:hypothetical protein
MASIRQVFDAGFLLRNFSRLGVPRIMLRHGIGDLVRYIGNAATAEESFDNSLPMLVAD